ncbi:unnamed protein product [Peniophora sp. CBMAI 1063]|nr:unnamed protein product [Peniophora sp. CBMAI 1063]
MALEASVPRLALENDVHVDITLGVLGEFDAGPSASTKDIAAKAGIRIQDLRKRIRAEIYARLAELRPAMRKLDDRFIPSPTKPIQAPMMNHGYALTSDQMLYCAEKFGVAPSRDVYRDGVPVGTTSKYNSGHLGLVQTCMRSYLECGGNVLSRSISVEEAFHPERRHLFILFSNYDVVFKRERARRFRLEGIKAIVEEMKRGFEGYERRVPRVGWHWDGERCGYGYSAPWDEYNLWPAEGNSHWRRKFNDAPAKELESRSPALG